MVTSFSQVTSSELSADRNFINYVTEFNKLVDYISATLNRSTYTTIQTEIENVKKQMFPKSEELAAVARILKYSDINQLGIDLDNIALNHQALSKKYGQVDNDVFLNSYSEISKNSSSNLPARAAGCRRPWRYALCAGAVGVEGALILAACETVTVGFGTPACVAGALIWAANGVATCSETYCDPVSH